MRALRLLGVAILILSIVPMGTIPPLIAPPFVRKWTQLVGEQAAVITVRDGVIYYRSNKGVGALDLITGQRKWSSLSNLQIPAAAIQDRTLYAIAQTDKTSSLEAMDSSTGQSRTLVRLAVAASHLAVDSERVYVLDESGKLQAFDPSSGAVLWSRQLGPAKSRGILSAHLAVTADSLYAGLDDGGEFGVSPKDGTVLWNHLSQYAGLYPPIVIGTDVISQNESLQRINVRIGKVVWKAEGGYGDAVLVTNVLVGLGQNDLLGRDVTNGRILWHLPLRDADSSYSSTEDNPSISDDKSVWVDRKPFVCVTKDGREKWNRSEPFTGTPCYADHEVVVTSDATRLLGYVAGTLPPLPTSDMEKRALAKRLASQFEILDDAERKQLEKLVPYSFQPLLARYVEWARTYDAKPEGVDSFALYCLLTDAVPLLLATCQKEDTGAIVTALSSLGQKTSWREELERILQARGNQAGYIPVLVKNLRRLPLTDRVESAALSAVSHSTHPEAVAFMLEALRDPQAAPAWRREAFQHLAGTGGPRGVQTVRAARHRRGSLKPWFDRIDFSKLDTHASRSIKTDAKGRTWMLFHSDLLGNASDLFIVQKLGAKWGRPLFTGVWTGRTFYHDAPKTFRGIPIAKLVSTEWIRIFPDDPTIRRDSDGDGLTDVVEARLGTNPRKADTDGDGLPDAIDPCPNAAPRVLGDTEKIIAACIEARFFLEDWKAPAILYVDNVKPFELYGYPSTLLWDVPRREIPMAQLYGGGVNMISFHLPQENARQAKTFIQYSLDHKTAHTVIRRYSGGLNGDGIEVTLKKIGDEWFVIDLQMRYVS